MSKETQTGPSESGRPNETAIAKRAYELSLQRGSVPGHEVDDWLQAEAELAASWSKRNEAAAPARQQEPARPAAPSQAAAPPPASPSRQSGDRGAARRPQRQPPQSH